MIYNEYFIQNIDEKIKKFIDCCIPCILSSRKRSIVWKMPHVQLSDAYKLYMLNVVNKQTPLLIPFRSWDIYYNPVVPQSTSFIWNVKLAVETERPRYIIIPFKKDKKYVYCDFTDVKVYLHSEVYPYDGLNQNFGLNR